MSKLKTAKAIRKSFAVIGVILKWTAISVGLGTVLWLLWLWMNGHFLSFAIVIGSILALATAAGIATLWDWSVTTIEEAEAEEREAQQRARAEKLRAERQVHEPSRRTVPFFEEVIDHEGWHH